MQSIKNRGPAGINCMRATCPGCGIDLHQEVGIHLSGQMAVRNLAMLVTLPLALGLSTLSAPRLPFQTLSSRVSPRMVASIPAPAATDVDFDTDGPLLLSSLNGKALSVEPSDVPTKAQVRAVVPDHCYEISTARSLRYVAQSIAATVACYATSALIPMKLAAAPLWLAWTAATGTAAMGLWVLAHECGHGAFSTNRRLQDAVGYVLHSLFLVPYYSWQRSHAVHHSRTNHISDGETHVPMVVNGVAPKEEPLGHVALKYSRRLGRTLAGSIQLFLHLGIGWPAYILAGFTGGPSRGMTSHFVPTKPFSNKLWPNKWPRKVWLSDVGVLGMLGALGLWASKAGLGAVGLFYGGPLLVVNAWLVVITWLQHTDVDVPHLADEDWSYMRGAFLTIDRNVPPLIDWLHHSIQTSHVAHHIDCTIPHYHAKEATEAIKKAFPKAYLYESTPLHKALWRVACDCIAVTRRSCGRYVFVPP